MNTLVDFRREAAPKPAGVNRLLLGDYVRKTEIGAFGEERGIEQTLRFNVTVETGAPGPDDDVDAILSYDTLVQAIDDVLGAERLDLLETLADRVADRLLGLPTVGHVQLRVEKLDRGPFTLGVEIERSAPAGLAPLPDRIAAGPVPVVAMVTPEAAGDPRLPDWFDRLAEPGRPVVLTACAAQGATPASTAEAQRQVDLLAMEQAAWSIAARDPRACVVDSRTELQHAMDTGLLAIWAPSRMVRRAREAPVRDDLKGLALTSWFARSLGADSVEVIDGGGPTGAARPLSDR